MFALMIVSAGLWSTPSIAQLPPGLESPGGVGSGGDPSDAFKNQDTEIHVKDADISAIIKIFSKKTKKNYILDERVKGKVSIYLPSKVSDSEAARVLDAILSLKGFTIVPVGADIFKVVPSKDARKTTIPTILKTPEDEPTATVITRLVRLNYVAAEDLQNLLNQLVSPDGMISAYARSNSLVIIDYADNIKRITDIIDSIDIPSSDTDMTIVPIDHADASEIAETLKQILGEDKKDDPNAASQTVDIIRNRLRQAAMARAEGSAGNGDASGGNAAGLTVAAKAAKIIPDARTNSIILVANETETMRLRALISRLDAPINLASNRFYVYRCQHASAEDLAGVLGGLTGSGGGASSATRSSGSSTLGGSGGATGGGFSNTGGQGRSSRSPGQSGLSQGSSPQTVNFGENVAITADPSTNSLIIAASKTDYEKILELLSELDIKRRQVLVEATILEVGIENSTNLGVAFAGSTGGADGGLLAGNGLNNLTGLFSDPTALSNFTLAAASSGSLKLPGGKTIPSQSILVRAAQASKNVNVLSAPNILTTDNEEAQIVVGNNVPFISSTSTSSENLNNTFNQVDRQDVGITLRITPQISSGDFVTLKIFTEVSDVVPSTADSALGPTTTLRTTETTVIVKSGQMIATGGLISDNSSESDEGVPLLKDIPVLGQLFKVNGDNKRQTNLLIFITPKVIKDQFDAREVTKDYRNDFQDKLNEDGIQPTRGEVLNSPSLDNVAEASVIKGPKPTTITPPAERTQPKIPDMFDEKTISIRSSPPAPVLEELPPQKIQKETSETSVLESISNEAGYPSAKHRANISELTTARQFNPGTTFIILRGLSDGASFEKLPFNYQKGSLTTLTASPERAQIARSFFKTGNKVGYRLGTETLDMEVVGVTDQIEELQQISSGSSLNWRSLTPHEIINLGNQPWVKR
jgi:general secretion pathway protein D